MTILSLIDGAPPPLRHRQRARSTPRTAAKGCLDAVQTVLCSAASHNLSDIVDSKGHGECACRDPIWKGQRHPVLLRVCARLLPEPTKSDRPAGECFVPSRMIPWRAVPGSHDDRYPESALRCRKTTRPDALRSGRRPRARAGRRDRGRLGIYRQRRARPDRPSDILIGHRAPDADEFSWSRIAAGTFLIEQFIAPGIGLPDGRLVFTVWGSAVRDDNWQCGVLLSDDGGRTLRYRQVGYEPDPAIRKDPEVMAGFNEQLRRPGRHAGLGSAQAERSRSATNGLALKAVRTWRIDPPPTASRSTTTTTP